MVWLFWAPTSHCRNGYLTVVESQALRDSFWGNNELCAPLVSLNLHQSKQKHLKGFSGSAQHRVLAWCSMPSVITTALWRGRIKDPKSRQNKVQLHTLFHVKLGRTGRIKLSSLTRIWAHRVQTSQLWVCENLFNQVLTNQETVTLPVFF